MSEAYVAKQCQHRTCNDCKTELGEAEEKEFIPKPTLIFGRKTYLTITCGRCNVRCLRGTLIYFRRCIRCGAKKPHSSTLGIKCPCCGMIGEVPLPMVI